jgi:hypothetical protein
MKTKHLGLAGLLVAGALACALVLAGCDNGGGGDGGGDPGGGDPVKIDIAAIEGVTAPATGATPVTAITATAQYTGTVAWNGNPATFAAETAYTATITLTAKAGYTLQGVTENFFTVAGTSSPATNAANSGTVTAVFPATAITPDPPWTGTPVYSLGDTGPGGGKIFYVSEAGFTYYQIDTTGITAHYLEAAPSDISETKAWASSAYIPISNGGTGSWVDISGTGWAIGTGRLNTASILATDTDAPAAKACNEYSNNGKNDWFLPSKDELNQLYTNRDSVGNLADYYWSSSQNDNYRSWYQLFSSGYQDYNYKYGPLTVRPVRAF